MAYLESKSVDIKAWFNKDLANEVVTKAAMKGLKKLGLVIEAEASELCPRDTGTLARSICTTVGFAPSETQSENIYNSAKNGQKTNFDDKRKDAGDYQAIVVISANTPYARKQHEDVSLRHPRGGQAKYLERAFNQYSKEAQFYVEDEISNALLKDEGKKWKS